MKGDLQIRGAAEEDISGGKDRYVVLFLVLLITFFVFSGSLKLEWTNWDDDLYVYRNPVVSEGTIKDIFTTSGDYNMFVPIVIASFALEWKIAGGKPFLYHLDNVLLHLLCTVLVLLLFRRMGLSVWWSAFAALLFGIHPMRVESVAWITERKELLCALFYLSALLAYVRYIASGKTGHLLFAFLFFILSMFSKAEAIILPFIIVLMDWYFQRKISPKVVLEKAAFFTLTIAVFLPQFFIFRKTNPPTVDPQAIVNVYNYFEQALLGCYVYAVYLLKSVFPYATSTLYPIPASLRAEHWIGAAMAATVFITALGAWRKYRFLTFGLLFFTLNISFLILVSFFLSDFAFLHDRYAYIAYTGLFFVIAMGMQKVTVKFPVLRFTAAGAAFAMLLVLGLLTVQYIPVWKNSQTLWTHVIEQYPRQMPMAYLNRGHYWYNNNRPDQAIGDFSAAVEIDPRYLKAYMNRGQVYLEQNDLKNALLDYNRSLELMRPYDESGKIVNPSVSNVLGNRGLIYSRMGQYEKALAEFDLAIKLNPSNPNNYLNRGFAYMHLREYEKCIRDFTLCNKYDPANPDIVNNRGVCYLRRGDLKSALDDFNKAIGLSGGNPSYYINRASVYFKSGRTAEAKQDLRTADQLGAGANPSSGKMQLPLK